MHHCYRGPKRRGYCRESVHQTHSPRPDSLGGWTAALVARIRSRQAVTCDVFQPRLLDRGGGRVDLDTVRVLDWEPLGPHLTAHRDRWLGSIDLDKSRNRTQSLRVGTRTELVVAQSGRLTNGTAKWI